MSEQERGPDLEALIDWAQERCHLLYEGTEVEHRSCGIALAETFGRPTASYQALRRGGITGHGTCGAIQAGVLILGEVFGDPDPRGPTTDALKRAAARYLELWQQETGLGASESVICNDLTGRFEQFGSAQRHGFCTNLAAKVARCVARTIIEFGGQVDRLPRPKR
jgi:hypothetical protein